MERIDIMNDKYGMGGQELSMWIRIPRELKGREREMEFYY